MMTSVTSGIFRISAVMIAVLSCLPIHADGLPEKFKSALRRALDSDAVWTMTKSFDSSPLKVTLNGRVSCAKGRGVIWNTEKPFKHRISMKADRMEFSDDNGVREVPEDDLPRYKDIRKAIDGFLAGSDAPFDRLFDVSVKESPGGWEVGFTPVRTDMRHLIKSVTVWGADEIDAAEFRYASGEKAFFKFKSVGQGVHSLWKESE